MHLGSCPPNDASDPTVQGVIGYIRNGRWHYVAVPALFAKLAAEAAVELAAQIQAIVDVLHDRTEPAQPATPGGTAEPADLAERAGLGGVER